MARGIKCLECGDVALHNNTVRGWCSHRIGAALLPKDELTVLRSCDEHSLRALWKLLYREPHCCRCAVGRPSVEDAARRLAEEGDRGAIAYADAVTRYALEGVERED